MANRFAVSDQLSTASSDGMLLRRLKLELYAASAERDSRSQVVVSCVPRSFITDRFELEFRNESLFSLMRLHDGNPSGFTSLFAGEFGRHNLSSFAE